MAKKKTKKYKVLLEYTLREHVYVDSAKDEEDARKKAFDALEWSAQASLFSHEVLDVAEGFGDDD